MSCILVGYFKHNLQVNIHFGGYLELTETGTNATGIGVALRRIEQSYFSTFKTLVLRDTVGVGVNDFVVGCVDHPDTEHCCAA